MSANEDVHNAVMTDIVKESAKQSNVDQIPQLSFPCFPPSPLRRLLREALCIHSADDEELDFTTAWVGRAKGRRKWQEMAKWSCKARSAGHKVRSGSRKPIVKCARPSHHLRTDGKTPSLIRCMPKRPHRSTGEGPSALLMNSLHGQRGQ